ncbi:MAG TPA: hypothetical protein VMF58_16985 [Rhizomicrobium sp.]|nr:hypothetical protein [Rhizomicrobium sp.]
MVSDPHPIRFLCVFASPRTGSSHFNKLLNSCPEIMAKAELFHRHAVGKLRPAELQSMEKWSNGAVKDVETFKTWKHENPNAVFEAFRAVWKRRVVAFKIFPGHLPRDYIEKELLARDDMAFAILRRRPIESFISGIKAKKGETFTLADTTAVKPALDFATFTPWSERMMNWYGWAERKLQEHGRSYAEISFERHLDGRSGAESLALVLEELEKAGLPKIPVPQKIIVGERQDRETDYRARVANWGEFESSMRADPDRARLLDWAEAAR